MQLFYSPDITQPLHTMDEQESAHCVKVLRLGSGSDVHLTDGRGNLFFGRIADAHPKRCTVEILRREENFGRLPYTLTVAVAPTKNSERMEWFVEKATEIGISRIIPIQCEHSERRTLNVERLERVAVSAMKQSVKAFLPLISPLTPLRDVISEPFNGSRFIAHCRKDADRVPFAASVEKGGNVLILIGPEGDFSQEEITFARENGFKETTLGGQRLRTETAALFAVAAVSVQNQ